MASVEEQIFEAVKAQFLLDLPWVKTIVTDDPFAMDGDVGHHVFPLIQIYWQGLSLQEQNNAYTITKAPFIVEIVDRGDRTRKVSNYTLFQYRQEALASIKSIRKIPTIPGFQQFSYLGRIYGVNFTPDVLYAQLAFQAWFQELYGQC